MKLLLVLVFVCAVTSLGVRHNPDHFAHWDDDTQYENEALVQRYEDGHFDDDVNEHEDEQSDWGALKKAFNKGRKAVKKAKSAEDGHFDDDVNEHEDEQFLQSDWGALKKAFNKGRKAVKKAKSAVKKTAAKHVAKAQIAGVKAYQKVTGKSPTKAGTKAPTKKPASGEWKDVKVTPELKKLVKKWAPEVVFHEREKYFPVSIEWYLKHLNIQDLSGKVLKKSPKRTDLHKYKASDKFVYNIPGYPTSKKKNDKVGQATSGSVFKVLKGMPVRKNRVKAPVYVRLTEENGNLNLQYLFMFTMNGCQNWKAKFQKWKHGIIPKGSKTRYVRTCDLATHQGDIERITVRLDAKTKKLKEFISGGHGDVHIHKPSKKEVKLNSKGHPIFYIAQDSHATYPNAGSHAEDAGMNGISKALSATLIKSVESVDHCSSKGARWETWNDFELIDDKTDWVNFGGKWGPPRKLHTGNVAISKVFGGGTNKADKTALLGVLKAGVVTCKAGLKSTKKVCSAGGISAVKTAGWYKRGY